MNDFPFGNQANKITQQIQPQDDSTLVDQLLLENDNQRQKYTELTLKFKKIQSKLEEKEKEIEQKNKKSKNLEKAIK